MSCWGFSPDPPRFNKPAKGSWCKWKVEAHRFSDEMVSEYLLAHIGGLTVDYVGSQGWTENCDSIISLVELGFFVERWQWKAFCSLTVGGLLPENAEQPLPSLSSEILQSFWGQHPRWMGISFQIASYLSTVRNCTRCLWISVEKQSLKGKENKQEPSLE